MFNKTFNDKQEIEKLVNELSYHDYRYHTLDAPLISDENYDRLYFKVKELNLHNSPTQKIGASLLDKFEKVRHAEPMLSLGNTFSYIGVEEFDRRIKKLEGHITSSVSKSTNYLILGKNPGSKLKKAQTLDIKTISYNKLIKLIDGGN